MDLNDAASRGHQSCAPIKTASVKTKSPAAEAARAVIGIQLTVLLDRLFRLDDHPLHANFSAAQPQGQRRSQRSPSPCYRIQRRIYQERLAGLFDLGDLDLVLAVLLGVFAGDFDLGATRAEVLVKTLADVTREIIHGGLVAFLDLNNVLAGIGFLQGALGTFSFTGQGDFFGFLGKRAGAEADGEQSGSDELGSFLHNSIHWWSLDYEPIPLFKGLQEGKLSPSHDRSFSGFDNPPETPTLSR